MFRSLPIAKQNCLSQNRENKLLDLTHIAHTVITTTTKIKKHIIKIGGCCQYLAFSKILLLNDPNEQRHYLPESEGRRHAT